ncbi:MAG TPA: ABC transporter substrate-binding protein [Nocardioidaceae bacterium]|nr:ABC transporter substrate-binding protein [Nocardioidaceae bacterium]
MTRRSRAWSLTASAATLALLVSACGSGDDDTTDAEGSGSGGAAGDSQGGTFSYALNEPTYLAPASQCYESECIAVLSAIMEPLVSVDLETGELVYDGVAESITSDDATNWTVKLKDGYTFHNGEPVNADAYIRAWNWTANPKNAAATAGFMSKIEGAGEGKSMSGVTKVDDLTIEVALTSPYSQFPLTMSYTPAWAAIAQECLDDLQACNEEPIGYGPYQMDGPWQHDTNITVTQYADYSGDLGGNAETISFDMFSDQVAAFRAWQGGTLDISPVDPTVYAEAKSTAGERFLEEPSSAFTYLGLPIEQEPFDDPDLRHALSLAIDRQTIIEQVLSNTAIPAKDIAPPIVPGAREDACEYCTYDPERAKQLFEEAGGIPSNKVTLWFNAGSGHDGWVEAVGNGWKQTFGIDFTLEAREWAQYLEIRSEGDFDGPYRLSWIMDYPSVENYLRPMYGTNGDVNYYGYSNETVDQALDEGDRASTAEESIAAYQRAGDQVLEDMPVIPMWFDKANYVWSQDVDNVEYSVSNANVDFRKVSVN